VSALARRVISVRTTVILGNVLVLGFLLLPIVLASFGAFQTEAGLLRAGGGLPTELTLANFQQLLGLIDASADSVPPLVQQFPRIFLNSLIVSVVATAVSVALGTLSAYSIARLEFRGRGAYAIILLITRMLPIIVLLIPLYLLLRQLRLLDTLAGIIIVEVGFLFAFATYILTSYFGSLPGQLEEAARVDGATRFGAFVRVMLPLATPGLASAAVVTFLLSWNDFLIPLTVSISVRSTTIPVFAASFVTDVNSSYSLVMAICLLGLAPTVVLALLLHRLVVGGLTAGAVKG
jgi:multiple sugar transport system permease protein